MTTQLDLRSGRLMRLARLAPPMATAVSAGAAALAVALVDPNEPGHYPTCPFLALTGLYCPGCGSLRAVHALAYGDVTSAVGLNVLTVLAVIALSVMWVRWAQRSWTGTPRRAALPPAYIWTMLVVVFAFGLLRNVPVGSALAP